VKILHSHRPGDDHLALWTMLRVAHHQGITTAFMTILQKIIDATD
jgi:hypothetical protein